MFSAKTKKYITYASLLLLPFITSTSTLAVSKLMYPLKQISALDCRFEHFSTLGSNCKIDLPILYTKDYKKYSTENEGYNDFTRIYTVLWGASYKYGWDAGFGGHQGVDIATAEGTPVYAIADGKVTIAKNLIGWGNNVSIEHTIDGKKIVSNYSHLSKITISEGDTVSIGDKIGEVGNTGNSFGNHLHFQIDLPSKFHPYYYDYAECPYSYKQITEDGVCYDVLAKHTLDPLAFLETNGELLSSITTITSKVSLTKKEEVPLTSAKVEPSIFQMTVYFDSSKEYIKKVQQVFKDIGEYKGSISGDYSDIHDDIVRYQIAHSIITSKTDDGAGYFGPKTRKQVQSEYEDIGDDSSEQIEINSQETVVTSSFKKVEKIEQKNLKTRAEIEGKEVEDFLRKYKIALNFRDVGSTLTVGQTKILDLEIIDSRGKGFKGSMPGELAFITDTTKVQVFPNKLFYFTDGKREIKVTGLTAGSTKLEAKIGTKVIKSFDINIYGDTTQLQIKKGEFSAAKESVIGETKTGHIVFKDTKGSKLVNTKYTGTYTLKTAGKIEVCVKKGNVKDLEKIYKKTCPESSYTRETTFTYADTVSGMLVFDYRVYESKVTIAIVDSAKKSIVSQDFTSSTPKGLVKEHPYYDEIVYTLKKGITSGINKGYFQQDKELVESEAVNWIKQTLLFMKRNTSDTEKLKQIEKKLVKIDEETPSKFTSITRQDLLEKAYKYLIFDTNASVSIEYKDLDDTENKKANTAFGKDVTWRDQFGKSYYRPDKTITRGETAFFLDAVLDKSSKAFVTVR